MSKSRFYKFRDSISIDIEEPEDTLSISNINVEGRDDDSDFLQDVPNSSSSVDRSSIGSIPWADDAIKQNQIDWEQVERMLIGQEPLPTEPDLRNEISEWQKKFPQLLEGKKELATPHKKKLGENLVKTKYGGSRPHARADDVISVLSLNSSDEEDQYDSLATPSADPQRNENGNEQSLEATTPTHKKYADRFSAKMALLRITALPLRARQRSDSTKAAAQNTSTDCEHSGTSNSLRLRKLSHSKPQPHSTSLKQIQPKAETFNAHHRFRMPPILNVLESKRRFRDLANNKSFVQLTHVQVPQAKSAAIIRQSEGKLPRGGQLRATVIRPQRQTAWQKPLIATRVSTNFFNNRNAIILPSLNTQHISDQQPRYNSTTTSTGAGTRAHGLLNTTFGSSASSAGFDQRPQYAADRFVSQWHHVNAVNTSTSTGSMSTGRSISAAVHHHPRVEGGFEEMYAPYHTYKHDGFK